MSREWTWEQTEHGWYVVEHGGMLKTGSFESKEAARQWFKEELEIELEEEAHVQQLPR
jgi:hypothetical protein